LPEYKFVWTTKVYSSEVSVLRVIEFSYYFYLECVVRFEYCTTFVTICFQLRKFQAALD
jgi:hypothetical protein